MDAWVVGRCAGERDLQPGLLLHEHSRTQNMRGKENFITRLGKDDYPRFPYVQSIVAKVPVSEEEG